MANPNTLARLFATYAHRNQLRKYHDTPYVTHLAEVAGLVATADPDYISADSIAIAWLHDVMEDCNVDRTLLTSMFGERVANGVISLSDLDIGNRAERMQKSRDRLAAAPNYIQTIKYADLISNTTSIVKHDPKFAEVYLEEKRQLLAVMTKGDPGLYKQAKELAYQSIP